MKKFIFFISVNLLTICDIKADSDVNQKNVIVNTSFNNYKNISYTTECYWRENSFIDKYVKVNFLITPELTVSGINNNEGNIRITLWDNSKNFIQDNQIPTKLLVIPTQAAEIVVFIEGLVHGKDYSIFVHHDKYKKGYLVHSVLGASDPYGFSNNAKGKFSAPKYEDVLIKINGSPTKRNIIIK